MNDDVLRMIMNSLMHPDTANLCPPMGLFFYVSICLLGVMGYGLKHVKVAKWDLNEFVDRERIEEAHDKSCLHYVAKNICRVSNYTKPEVALK